MRVKRLTKPRFLFVYPLVVALFLVAHITEESFRLGVVLVVLGQALRFWANGYVGHIKVNWTQKWRGDTKIGRLVTAGPYAFVRHPLYLGTLLIGAGFCVAVGSLWLSLAAFTCFLVLYRSTMAREERLLHDECGAEYHIYHAAVPRLLPTWHRYPSRQGRWNWRGIVASKEWKAGIWTTVLVILLYFREESMQEPEWLFGERRVFRLCLLGLLLALIIGDGLVELVRHRVRGGKVTVT